MEAVAVEAEVEVAVLVVAWVATMATIRSRNRTRTLALRTSRHSTRPRLPAHHTAAVVVAMAAMDRATDKAMDTNRKFNCSLAQPCTHDTACHFYHYIYYFATCSSCYNYSLNYFLCYCYCPLLLLL